VIGCVSGILVTGDIAFSGKKTEYENATGFLSELCQLLKAPKTIVYCVPGNHDVDHDITRESHSLDRAQITIETAFYLDAEISGFLRDPNSKSMIYSHIHEYNNFSAQFNCNIDSDAPTWSDDLKLNDGSVLGLYGLNSIIISSHRDKRDRKMVLGTHQLPRNKVGVSYISLCHHPPEIWRDSDETKTTLLNRIHIQLYGHKHTQSIIKQNNSLIIFAGAAHPSRSEKKWRPRYNWLSIHVDGVADGRSLRIRVHPRVLNDQNNRFVADTNNCNGNDFIEHCLKLERWEVEKATSLEAGDVSNINDKTENKDNQTTNTSIMNPIRTIVYRFFGLSYTTRSLILNELELIYDEDEGIEHTKLFRTLLKRAEEKKVLSRLWERIQESHGDGKYKTNPFKNNSQEGG